MKKRRLIQEWKPKAYYFSFFFELRCALARLSINQLDNNRKTNLLMYTPLWQTPLAGNEANIPYDRANWVSTFRVGSVV